MSHLPVGFREMHGLSVDSDLTHLAMLNGRPEPKRSGCRVAIDAFFGCKDGGYRNSDVLERGFDLIFCLVFGPAAQVLVKRVLMGEPILERGERFVC